MGTRYWSTAGVEGYQMMECHSTKSPVGIELLRLAGRGPLNLLGRESFLNLNTRLDQSGGDPKTRAVIVAGTGQRAFSAGVDLLEMKELTPLEAESFIRIVHKSARKLLTLAVPTIAAIQGPCLGGALELALACDIRIAAEDAKFGLPEVRVGVPSVIEASLLPRTIGLGRARHMLLTGDTLDAQQALDIGLVDRLVPKDLLLDRAFEAAQVFYGMSRDVLSLQKDIIAKWLELGEEEATEYSIKAFALNFASPHPREAMEAFLEKRQPLF